MIIIAFEDIIALKQRWQNVASVTMERCNVALNCNAALSKTMEYTEKNNENILMT